MTIGVAASHPLVCCRQARAGCFLSFRLTATGIANEMVTRRTASE